jgi:uncharacterized protein YqeY
MNLKEKIDTDIKTAMVDRNNIERDILRVVKSEIQRSEAGLKTFEDADIVKLMRGQIENLKVIGTERAKKEIWIIEQYLPKMMDHEEIESKITYLISTGINNLGAIMKHFNEHHKGMVDNKKVSEIVKQKLS